MNGDGVTAIMCRLARDRAPVIVTRRGRSELVTLVYWPGTIQGRSKAAGGTKPSGGRPKVRDRAGRTYAVPIESVRVPQAPVVPSPAE